MEQGSTAEPQPPAQQQQQQQEETMAEPEQPVLGAGLSSAAAESAADTVAADDVSNPSQLANDHSSAVNAT